MPGYLIHAVLKHYNTIHFPIRAVPSEENIDRVITISNGLNDFKEIYKCLILNPLFEADDVRLCKR